MENKNETIKTGLATIGLFLLLQSLGALDVLKLWIQNLAGV